MDFMYLNTSGKLSTDELAERSRRAAARRSEISGQVSPQLAALIGEMDDTTFKTFANVWHADAVGGPLAQFLGIIRSGVISADAARVLPEAPMPAADRAALRVEYEKLDAMQIELDERKKALDRAEKISDPDDLPAARKAVEKYAAKITDQMKIIERKAKAGISAYVADLESRLAIQSKTFSELEKLYREAATKLEAINKLELSADVRRAAMNTGSNAFIDPSDLIRACRQYEKDAAYAARMDSHGLAADLAAIKESGVLA